MGQSETVTLPARLVLGHATFLDPEKPGVAVAAVAYRDPRYPGSVVLDGPQVYVADTIPLRLSAAELRGELEGEPFGAALLRALPPSMRAQLFQRRGEALSDSEVLDLQGPLMRLAFKGDLIIAATPAPPTPDPVYVRFTPNMLGHWRFIPGMDIAAPTFPAALEYLSVRVFSPASWNRVELAGGRLRARPMVDASPLDPSGAVVPQDAATTWMRQHVQQTGDWKREGALRACMDATSANYRAALAAWNALPTHVRGQRGAHK